MGSGTGTDWACDVVLEDVWDRLCGTAQHTFLHMVWDRDGLRAWDKILDRV